MTIIMKFTVLLKRLKESQFIDFIIFHANVHVSLGRDQVRPWDRCNRGTSHYYLTNKVFNMVYQSNFSSLFNTTKMNNVKYLIMKSNFLFNWCYDLLKIITFILDMTETELMQEQNDERGLISWEASRLEPYPSLASNMKTSPITNHPFTMIDFCWHLLEIVLENL